MYYLFATLYFTEFAISLNITLFYLTPVTVSLLFTFYWYSNGTWRNHPVSRVLRGHIRDPDEWVAVANTIATEYRRFDKFVYGKTWGKVVVTDNWIIRCGLYETNIAYQPDIHLAIQSANVVTDTNHQTAQFVNINVSSVNNHCKDFVIRLNVTDYNDLTAKIQAPILNLRNIVFQQSVSDRFEMVFREEVEKNGTYVSEQQQEECIGCLFAPADIKLSKLCDDASAGDCKNCLCRPMWCLKCLAKWFANRQNEHSPETWLSGKAPCPTCRSRFCPRDVQLVAWRMSTG